MLVVWAVLLSVFTSQFELQLLDQLLLLRQEGGRGARRPLRSRRSLGSWKTMLQRHTNTFV